MSTVSTGAQPFTEDDLFDDCPVCQAQKAAMLEGRNASLEELTKAFKAAKDQEVI